MELPTTGPVNLDEFMAQVEAGDERQRANNHVRQAGAVLQHREAHMAVVRDNASRCMQSIQYQILTH